MRSAEHEEDRMQIMMQCGESMPTGESASWTNAIVKVEVHSVPHYEKIKFRDQSPIIEHLTFWAHCLAVLCKYALHCLSSHLSRTYPCCTTMSNAVSPPLSHMVEKLNMSKSKRLKRDRDLQSSGIHGVRGHQEKIFQHVKHSNVLVCLQNTLINSLPVHIFDNAQVLYLQNTVVHSLPLHIINAQVFYFKFNLQKLKLLELNQQLQTTDVSIYT